MVKHLDRSIAQESKFLHGPFVPFDVRIGDPIVANIRTNEDASWHTVRVWRYSPFGIEIVAGTRVLEVGSKIDLILRSSNDETLFKDVTVASSYTEGDVQLSGIRLFVKSDVENNGAEKRTKTRWKCTESFLPTGSASNPLKFNDYLFFSVVDLSANGMKIITSMRNKAIIRGQRLNSILSLPCIGSVQCSFEVVRVDYERINGKEFVVFGVEYTKRDDNLLKALAEYLLHFAEGITVAALSKNGFPISGAYKMFDFTHVKTQEEYEEVLALRLKAYRVAGKVQSDATPQAMADEFDTRSRILAVKHAGRIVASVRVIFHDDTDVLSYGRYFQVPPDKLPDRRAYAEASRMCIDPEYQGADIFYHLAEHAVITTVKSGRRYIVGGSAGKITEKWRKCGFRKLGITYESKDIAGIEHDLILMDTHQVALGNGISVRLWNRIFGRMVSYMLENRLIEPTSFDLLRISIIRALIGLGLVK